MDLFRINTMSLTNNLGKYGIRVKGIAPSWIDTDMSTEESMLSPTLCPLGRNEQPEEVAKLVKFLASNDAEFINGQILRIDGGYGNVNYVMKLEQQNFL